MEWEVMFMCNLMGVLLLVAIAFFHVLGNAPEKNAEILNFDQDDKRNN